MKRKSVLKKLLICLAVFLLLYLNLNMCLSHQIKEEIQKASMEGEITNLERVGKERVRYNNRSLIYLAAGELVELNLTPEDFPHRDRDPGKYYRENKDRIDKELQKNEMVLALMDEAYERSECDFAIEYEKGMEMYPPGLIKLKDIAYLLSMKAMNDIESGNYDGAIKRCAQCLSMAKDVSDTRILIGHMIALRIIDTGIKPLKYMEKDKIHASYAPVIDELTAISKSFDKNFIQTLELERTIWIDCWKKSFNDPSMTDPYMNSSSIFYAVTWYCIIHPLLKPYFLSEELYYIRYMNELIDEIQKDPSADFVQKEPSKYHIYSSRCIPNFGKAFEENRNTLLDCNELLGNLVK